jgi:hypothetical protein
MIDEELKVKVDGVNGVMDLLLEFEFEFEFELERIGVAEIETVSWFLGGLPMSTVKAKGTSSLSFKTTSSFNLTTKLLQHFVVTTALDCSIRSVFIVIVAEDADNVVQ